MAVHLKKVAKSVQGGMVDPKLPDPDITNTMHKDMQPQLPAAQQQRPIYRWSMSRREFVSTAGLLTGGAVMGFPIRGSGATVTEVEQHADETTAIPLQLTVNGKQQQLMLDPRTTLL
ncbi:MAG TPA: hypothetical protein VHV32_11560, partial [Candidatus Angelobacter sp.]|nr:hypothetical protein [Candidatus Angelobacter sp.]